LEGVQLSYRFMLFTVIASSLFPRIPLGFSSGLGAFRATPRAPHLERSVTYLLYVLIAVTTYKPI